MSLSPRGSAACSPSPPRSHARPSRSSRTLLPPSDPVRQAKRLPVRILSMLSAHSGHMLHPEYLQPLSSAALTIELDAKKSPLALLAQTCSQIGKPDPPHSSKLSSLTSALSDSKESSSRNAGHKHSEGQPPPSSTEDRSSFKPYSKGGGDMRKEMGSAPGGASEKGGFRGSFIPHAASPAPRSSSSPQSSQPSPPVQHVDSKPAVPDPGSLDGGKKDLEASKQDADTSSEGSPQREAKLEPHSDPHPTQPGLSSGHVAPVSPFKSAPSVFPLPPSGLGYHGSIVGAYAGYPSPYVPGLEHSKAGLVGGAMGVAGKHPSSSPLTGASPPSFLQGLCRDPYCLSYPPLGGCLHDPSSSSSSSCSSSPSLKSGFPLVYPGPPLHAPPLYTYGFLLPNEPLPHACNWVSAGGPCDKRFSTSEELLSHLRSHTALLPSYPSPVSSSSSSCHLHLAPPTSPASYPLRPPPNLGLARYHPYGKAHLPGSASLPPASPYYSPYALYSHRLGSASALGYQ